MERRFGSYEMKKPRKRCFRGFWKVGDQCSRFSTSVRTTNASATHLVIFARVPSSVFALPLEKKVSAPPATAPDRPELFPGLEQHDDDQEDTGEELDDGESKNKTVHEIQSFLF